MVKLHFSDDDFDKADHVGEIRRKPDDLIDKVTRTMLQMTAARLRKLEEDLDRTVVGLPLNSCHWVGHGHFCGIWVRAPYAQHQHCDHCGMERK